MGTEIYSLAGPYYLPNADRYTADKYTYYIPDVEIEFDIFIHESNRRDIVDYQIMKIGNAHEYQWNYPNILLEANDTAWSRPNGMMMLGWNAPDASTWWGGDFQILPTGEWTHIYIRLTLSNAYVEYNGFVK